MTQQQARSAYFGPTWPEVAWFGEGTPQQADLGQFTSKGKWPKYATVATVALLAG